MEELNSDKSPCVRLFTHSRAVDSGHMIRQRAMETWPIKGMPVWGMTLWKFEGCIKVGHVDANQKKSLKMSWYGVTAAVQRWAESRHVPFPPSQEQNANKNCSVCQEEKDTADSYGEIPWWQGPEHCWPVRLMLVTLGDYKWVLTGIDADSELGFTIPTDHANAFSAKENL